MPLSKTPLSVQRHLTSRRTLHVLREEAFLYVSSRDGRMNSSWDARTSRREFRFV